MLLPEAWPEQRRRTAAALRHERELNDLTAKVASAKSSRPEWHLQRSRSESAIRDLVT